TEIDSSSPYLYKAVTTGQTLQSAEFRWYKINDAGQEVEYFNTRLENVKVVKVNQRIDVVLREQAIRGELRYAIDAELKGIGLVRYGTEFMPEGRVLIRHLKQQQYLDTRAAL